MQVRLNRYLSMCGVTSRRKADDLIKQGRVKVNGEVVRSLGVRIDPDTDRVEVDGKEVKPPKKRYVILNKPSGYLTQLGTSPDGRRTIQELIKDIPERVYPVGRLDYNTEGLLLLTNDGELANRVLHPRYKLPKVYVALVKGVVPKNKLRKMRAGIELEDAFAKPDDVKILRYEGPRTWIQITFHEGRKHIVKRFLARFGHPVVKLIRVAIGPIRLGDLPKGKWRDLTGREIRRLFKAVGLKYSPQEVKG